MRVRASIGASGAPLSMIGLVLAAWVSSRALLWGNPLPMPADLLPSAFAPLTEAAPKHQPCHKQRRSWARSDGAFALLGSGLAVGIDPRYAAGHQYLWRAALRAPLTPPPRLMTAFGASSGADDPPFLPAPPMRQQAGRWSLDAWGFWRQGSDAAPISQGRVPIYGASQIGAVLQYRLAPANARDPRLYARAYRAILRRGESELALGASLRPLPRVPVRVFGEVRYTEGAFRSEARPAAYAVTEVAPLPLGTQLEAYAQGGWVGGTDDTLFADGQASLTREVGPVIERTGNALRLSLGAGAWGGAQEGAHRIDLGPTMRIDVTPGKVPARLALDWRERVEGDAGPGSGAAVTLSTRF